jgi:hypothetical protein
VAWPVFLRGSLARDTVSQMRERSGNKAKKPPTEPNRAAKAVLGAIKRGAPAVKKNAAAVALGRLGGLRGGKARAAKMSDRQRSASARKAAKARWETL